MRGQLGWICTSLTAIAAIILAGCEATPDGRDPLADRQASRSEWDDGPDEELRPRPILSETHLAAGRLHESQGQFVSAIEQYEKAIEIEPAAIEAHNRLGLLLIRMGQLEKAEKTYEKALAIAPEEAHLSNNLGFCYTLQARWEDARTMFTKALEINPSFERAHVNLAMALAQQDRFEEALNHFQAALAPDSAHFNMGLMYQSRSRVVEAARSYLNALEVNPNLVAARKRLDQLPDEAVQEARRQGHAIASPSASADGPQTRPLPAQRGLPQSRPASSSLPPASSQPAASSRPAPR